MSKPVIIGPNNAKRAISLLAKLCDAHFEAGAGMVMNSMDWDGIICRDVDPASADVVNGLCDYKPAPAINGIISTFENGRNVIRINQSSIDIERLEEIASMEDARINSLFEAKILLERVFPADLGVVFEPVRKYLVTQLDLEDTTKRAKLAYEFENLLSSGTIRGMPIEYRDGSPRDFAVSHVDYELLNAAIEGPTPENLNAFRKVFRRRMGFPDL